MILHEDSNDIELQYGSMGDWFLANRVSAGIENDPGTIGLQIYSGQSDATEQATLQNRGFLISQNQNVPEPSTLGLIGLGLLGLARVARRRRYS